MRFLCRPAAQHVVESARCVGVTEGWARRVISNFGEYDEEVRDTGEDTLSVEVVVGEMKAITVFVV